MMNRVEWILLVALYFWAPQAFALPTSQLAGTILKAGTRTVEISVRRKPMHPYLAEFNRELILKTKNNGLKNYEMSPDTGGTLKLNAYLSGHDLLFLQDRIDCYEIRLEDLTLTVRSDRKCPVEAATFVGAFDEFPPGTWAFIPPGVQSEKLVVVENP